MAINVLYLMQFRQVWKGIRTSTQWAYFNPLEGDGGSAYQFCLNWQTNILPMINAAQGDYVSNLDVSCWSGAAPYTTYTLALTGGGGRTTTATDRPNMMNVASFRWLVGETQYGLLSPVIKRGYTRISGLLDADFSDGELIDSWPAAYGYDIADAMTQSVTVGGVDYFPAIHVNPAGEADTWRVKQVVDVGNIAFGSQVTRKK